MTDISARVEQRDGWPVLVRPDGRVWPMVRGGEGPTPPAPPAPTPPAPTPPAPEPQPSPQPAPAPAPPGPSPDLTALQSALDQATVSGRTEALQPLMQLVGVNTPQALQEWVTAAHEAAQARLSDDQRREQELAQREAAAAQREAAANTVLRNGRVRDALVRAGAPIDQAGDLIPLVVMPDGDTITDEQVTAAVDAAKTKFPALFTATPTPPAPTPPAPSSRAPGAPPPAPPGPADPLEAGRERARRVAADRGGATKDDLVRQFSHQPSPLAPTA